MTNREKSALLGVLPIGGIANNFIKEDLDDKKWQEQTNYSAFNPSAGQVEGAAGEKNVNRNLVDRGTKGWVKGLESAEPFMTGLYTAAAGVGVGALAGPAAGKLASGLYQQATKLGESDTPDMQNVSNDAANDIANASKGIYGSIEANDSVGESKAIRPATAPDEMESLGYDKLDNNQLAPNTLNYRALDNVKTNNTILEGYNQENPLEQNILNPSESPISTESQNDELSINGILETLGKKSELDYNTLNTPSSMSEVFMNNMITL